MYPGIYTCVHAYATHTHTHMNIIKKNSKINFKMFLNYVTESVVMKFADTGDIL